MIATSNRPPADLYKDGLNRELFLPFIDLIESRFEVVEVNGPTDYRLRAAGRRQGLARAQRARSDRGAERGLLQAHRLSGRGPRQGADARSLTVGGGRTLHVPKSLKGVAVFSFKRLCGEPRGAADYLAIAQRFHTVILVGIPVMSREMRNEAARFVDPDRRRSTSIRSSCSPPPMPSPPASIRQATAASNSQRTASRLQEMRSAEYLAEGHGLDQP